MPVVFKCDCGKYLSVRSKSIGKKVNCPECAAVNIVPDPTTRRTRRVKRLKTDEMSQEKLGRLKSAAEKGVEEIVRDDELVELQLPGGEADPPARKSEKRRRKKNESGRKASGAPAGSGGAPIEMTCFCGKKHHASVERAGEEFRCEDCGRTITIPGGGRADIALMPLEEGEPCPKCGTLLDPEVKACRSCGHHLDLRLRSSGRIEVDLSEEKRESKSKRKKR
jgi:DNA-directed RNA polymerase subunit M/transcription elongation factor TFIIS